MESFQAFGGDGNEECQSSESGWTIYLQSPRNDDVNNQQHSDYEENADDDDDDDDDDSTSNDDKENDDNGGQNDNDDSDDSMASDASSGPSYTERRRLWRARHGKGSGKTTAGYKQYDNKEGDHDDEDGNSKKGTKMQREETRRKEK